ncbi:DNA polymerase III subunit epsilon [Aeromonas salmonicida subsp. salmonicida]|uniref:3'-5' exonuclease n=1 Tax=Aeromonas salmonicida TaxID=645 RepID=UPI000935DC44|nr:3'-5' exonuclease [Aeromonas salmonicida]OKA92254.1 DNA polymerase III subunit epsilon [Aeromonas salmonicida subsp. salmonicida]OKB16462.1 DNA polymerase III subunit epsilon [Aeromonas salmonicida subsp. salmonicida]PJZ13896.1 DNA polymerase III subunit epsilon [Aeromonas salmonicida subsp. salmonicida]RYJ24299.1 DNA polymerase III subunit epsilon [Aeromonas salmonicida subsp. salmonicida]TKY41203.1 DNA polymerase III subunit epsilon [Aeromonas salmonicida subsp. salmonicida]
MWSRARRYWHGRAFRTGEFAPLFALPPEDELIALDFETTSLDPARAEIVSIGAVRIKGNRILTGEALSLRVQAPASLNAQSVVIHGLRQLLAFIGPRELVGYHIAYDLRILNLACQKQWGLTLAQQGIEVSRLYHDHLYRRYPDAVIDLHLAAIRQHLNLPSLPVHDALSDAITAALIYLRLTQGGPLAYPKV